MHVQPIRTRIFTEGEDLVAFISRYLPALAEKSVVVVTSKIVALAERRTAQPTATHTKNQIIIAESDYALKTKHVWLTIRDGMLLPSAGIDESNANGKLILLPKDSFASAKSIRRNLQKKLHLKNVGVLITDSRTQPLRAGVMGVALGYAGFGGLRDYRKKKDIFGRPFKYSQLNLADCLASAAVAVMGEGNEQHPLACITEAPVDWKKRDSAAHLRIPLADDMYAPLLKNLTKKNPKPYGHRT